MMGLQRDSGELSYEENKDLPSFQIADLGRRKVSWDYHLFIYMLLFVSLL